MPTPQELLDEIDTVLGSGITKNYTAASAANDLFEGFIFSLIISAARAEGAQVSFETVFGKVTNHLVFRTSPGNIYSTARPYTHARIRFDGCPDLEAHIGIYVSGRSKVIHECDIAVLDSDEATICRNAGVHPRSGKVTIAVECKFHATILQLGQARGFLGLVEELSKEGRFLVTNTFSGEAEKMVTYHRTGKEFQLDLRDPRIVRNFQSKIEQRFHDYKVANR